MAPLTQITSHVLIDLTLAAGGLAFLYLLGRRLAEARHHQRLRVFARSQRLTVRLDPDPSPRLTSLLTDLPSTTWTPLLSLTSPHAEFWTLRSSSTPASRHPAKPHTWHLLLLPRTPSLPPSYALRPAQPCVSIIDLFAVGYARPSAELTSCPSVESASPHFTLFAPPHLPRPSPAPPLPQNFPPDLSLLSRPDSLVIDFSTRPFTPAELIRLLNLAAAAP